MLGAISSFLICFWSELIVHKSWSQNRIYKTWPGNRTNTECEFPPCSYQGHIYIFYRYGRKRIFFFFSHMIQFQVFHIVQCSHCSKEQRSQNIGYMMYTSITLSGRTNVQDLCLHLQNDSLKPWRRDVERYR